MLQLTPNGIKDKPEPVLMNSILCYGLKELLKRTDL